MKIKDIRFTGYTTLTNCESEPIHVPGTIQPFGFFLAVNSETLKIDFCSTNIIDFWDIETKTVLGKSLEEVIGKEECENILRHTKSNTADQYHTLTFKSATFSTFIYSQNNLLMLEIERSPDETLSLPDLYKESNNFISYLEISSDLRELSTHVADQIRDITGYDRVMVYRFDKEYNGEVFAESLNENIESFLGLRYPHTDIPPQARALFVRNLLRMIPDVNYKPVPVMTLLEDAAHHSVDMSSGGLRSVSPIHIQYLKNMAVGASLTISLIHNQKLWGLIACHHSSPKIIAPYTRLSTKLLAHFLTSQISNREAANEYKETEKINNALNYILADLDANSFDYDKKNEDIYLCLNADGVSIINEGNVYMYGKTPTMQQIIDLVAWLDIQTEADYFVTTRLNGKYEEALEVKDIASGIFYHSMYKGSKNGIIWFKKENKEIISWAGDPEKAIEVSNESLLPRKSFASWKEVVANASTDWKTWEINAAIRLATKIQNAIFLKYIIQEEKKYRLQSLVLQKANEELINYNYICSHDLQEPVRKIQVFSNQLLSDRSTEVEKLVILKKINESASRSSKQIHDLLELAKLSNHAEAMEEINLETYINKIKTDLELSINEKNATITCDSSGIIKGIPLQIEQLVKKLIDNALKFSKGDKPEIHVSLDKASILEIKEFTSLNSALDYVCLRVRDNGIGFDQQFAAKLFKIFYRMNIYSMYKGNGMGLTICKKIVDNHFGHIIAESEYDKGSTFIVYLPQ